MRSLCSWLAGIALAGILVGSTSGCGGNSGLEKPPDTTTKPSMSSMPGYNENTKKMETTPTKK